jgi:uncharacterized protein YukE
MTMLLDGGGFDVTPSTLLGASGRITRLGNEVGELESTLRSQGQAAQSSLDEVAAGFAWSEVIGAWSKGISALHRALTAYGSNTMAAAVAYEDVDSMALPTAPKIPAPAPEIDWDEYCKPNLFGMMPDECYIA